MLKVLFEKGPFTVGIFRKSANARVCKEFRAKLESDPDADVTDVPVMVISSVFKVNFILFFIFVSNTPSHFCFFNPQS